MNAEEIIKIFQDKNILKSSNSLHLYKELGRFYHNFNHIQYLIDKAYELKYLIHENNFSINEIELLLSIFYHDVAPNDDINQSINLFKKECLIKSFHKNVEEAILSTKNHIVTSILSEKLIALDLNIFNEDISFLIKYEQNIFKEYQKYSLEKYIEGRLIVLNNLKNSVKNIEALNFLINYVKNRIYNIGIYSGSFNPFHEGHENILQQSEEFLDKVVIMKGINYQKINNEQYDFPKSYRELDYHKGLLSDYILQKQSLYTENNINFKLTLIRGIRNTQDFERERDLSIWLKENFNLNINIVFLFPPSKLIHISSSTIREIEHLKK